MCIYTNLKKDARHAEKDEHVHSFENNARLSRVGGHHLFVDDIQLFISFRAPEFSANILHLQNTIDLASQWMSANLFSLYQSKTEFLLIGLPAQLSKISDSSLLMPSNVTITPAQSARNLGLIFDCTLCLSYDRQSVQSKIRLRKHTQ